MRFNIVLFVASGIIAFCSYALLVLFFLGVFKGDFVRYASLKESAIMIEAIDIQAYLNLTPTPPKSQASTNNPLEGSGLKSMFEQIDTNQYSQIKEPADDRDKYAQNAKKLNELAQQSRDLHKQLHNLSTISIENDTSSNKDGIYDEWFAQIEKILQAYWDKQRYYLANDLMGVVAFEINSQGKMNFIIKRYALDENFDNALNAMLNELKHYPFPAPKRSQSFSVEFKSTQTK